MAEAVSITQLLAEWNAGDRTALDELTPRVQRELAALARHYLERDRGNQTLQPTALINEVYLRLIDQAQPIEWQSRSHFFGIAARFMRQILVDYARKRRAGKRGGCMVRVTLTGELAVSDDSRQPDMLDLDAALNRLAEVDERKARVIELRYFSGMTREEIACALSLSVATVKRDLRVAEAWLRRDLRELSEMS